MNSEPNDLDRYRSRTQNRNHSAKKDMTIHDYIDKDPQVKYWWDNIEEIEKNKLLRSWSPKSESCRYTFGNNDWRELPIIIVGKLTDKKENKEWNSDLYDFFVSHPEFFISGLPICFHVCTREESVRKTLRAGILRKDFICSSNLKKCIMKPILKVIKEKSLIFKAYKINDKTPNA